VTEYDAVVCSDVVAEHGEGPVWDDLRGELVWVDIGDGVLHRGRPAADGSIVSAGSLTIDGPLGAVAPAASGGWVVAAGPGFARLAENGALEWLAQPDAERPEVRMNDGACDPAGRFWAGTMAYDTTPGAGTLYRLDPDGAVHVMVAATTISNGLGWSADRETMWFADSGDGTVDAFDFHEESGAIDGRRTVIEIDSGDGVPDGLTVDAEDHLWVAVWDGGEVRRYTPAGALVARVKRPVSRPTSCCFGGAALETLYVSTASVGLDEAQRAAQPLAGRLFRAEVAARGVTQPRFGA
jgi:sugar lactone lactonase YvrE